MKIMKMPKRLVMPMEKQLALALPTRVRREDVSEVVEVEVVVAVDPVEEGAEVAAADPFAVKHRNKMATMKRTRPTNRVRPPLWVKTREVGEAVVPEEAPSLVEGNHSRRVHPKTKTKLVRRMRNQRLHLRQLPRERGISLHVSLRLLD
jgi:hypothetical protein